ncbi:MAG TPA: hypothetical protein VLA56_20935 [Pseudomonadales bacterium]|nr:hypothetical protein [Pseudomonadales bacterium]
MNWDAIGAIGELVGAAAVVATLLVLMVQIRHSTRAMEESNRLDRAAAIDRHSDSIGRWRGRLMEHPELAAIWAAARDDEPLDAIQRLRLNNLWIDLVNTQRSNYVRGHTVGETGLARQALMSIAAELNQSELLRAEWELSRPWHALASPEFVAEVEAAAADLRAGADPQFRVRSDR